MSSPFIFSLIASVILHCCIIFGGSIKVNKNPLIKIRDENTIEVSILKVLPVVKVDGKALNQKVVGGVRELPLTKRNLHKQLGPEQVRDSKLKSSTEINSGKTKIESREVVSSVDIKSKAETILSAQTKISVPQIEAVQMQKQIKRLLVKFPPVYPFLARKKGWEGEVLIVVKTDNIGNIVSTNISSSSGYTILDDSAENAVKKWRFSGVKAPMQVKIPVRFVLSTA